MAMLKAGWIGFLKDHPDFWGAAAKLAELGYQGTESEFFLAEGDIRENARRFADMGLRLLTVRGGNPQDALEDTAGKIERAHVFGCDRVTIFFSSAVKSFHENRDGTYDEMMKDLEDINRAIELYSKEGLQVCYHNHFQEFTLCFKNSPFFEHMLHNCDERLMFDLDVGWITAAGLNPCQVLKRMHPRNVSVHLKDFYDMSRPASLTGFTALGTGLVDFQSVLKKAVELEIPWVVVEQDQLRNLSLMETMTASYYHIKESGLVE